jgi:ferredoxin
MINIKVKLNLEQHEVEISENITILEGLKSLDPPHSCLQGHCSSCQCKLISGEVDMKNNLVLTEREIESGFILACQCYAKTDIEIDFDY